MRTAVISDIHGNLEALEAVLKRIEKERVDEIVCLGDIVGYGPNPNECLSLIRSTCVLVVLGNHDEWVLRRPDHSRVPEAVWQSILWTAGIVEDQHKVWISGLPLIVHRDREIFVQVVELVCHYAPELAQAAVQSVSKVLASQQGHSDRSVQIYFLL